MRIMTTLALAAALGVLPSSCGSEATPTQPTLPGSCPATPTAASGAASNPVPPARRTNANYAGTWSGQYHVIGCSRTCGLGPSVCDMLLPPPGMSLPLRLALAQNGEIVSGTLDLFNNLGNRIVETGPVTGTIDDSDALLLSGTTHTTDPSEPAQSTLSGWKSTVVGDGNLMSGRFIRNWSFENFWKGQQLKVDCELVNFRRAAS